MADCILPPPSPPGARVHVVAPSWAIDGERVQAGVALVEAEGYEVFVPPAVHARRRFLAGDDDTRLAALQGAIEDPLASVVWVAQGGYGATRLLAGLDPRRIARRPKLLVGFSDATALHAAWQRAGVATLHAANLSTLAQWSEDARQELYRMLAGEQGPALEGSFTGGEGVEGPLLGGNLSLLAAMTGTGALPDLEGALLLLEDVDERTYRLDRYVQQLRQSGALEGVAGFVLGQFTSCGSTRGDDADAVTILREALAGSGRPILSGLPLGHDRTARPAWLGRRARIEPTAPGRAIFRTLA